MNSSTSSHRRTQLFRPNSIFNIVRALPGFRAVLPRLLIAGLFASAAGCWGDGKMSVSGDVIVGGQPVDQGVIRFAPADGIGPTDGATITAGKYSVQLTPGSKQVHIEGHRQVGQEKQNPDDPSSPVLPIYEPIVNVDVTADISAGRSDLNFDLPETTSKP